MRDSDSATSDLGSDNCQKGFGKLGESRVWIGRDMSLRWWTIVATREERVKRLTEQIVHAESE